MSTKKPGGKRPYEQPRRAINAGITGALYGFLGGVIIARSTPYSIPAALICALFFGFGESLTDYRRQTGLPFPGHYLSFFEGTDLTVLNLQSFGEEIEVYVKEEILHTDHRFYLGNHLFLTLFYTMHRLSEQAE